MDIDFREIVEILEIDAPVHFTPKDELDKNNYVFCRFMSNAERDAIIDGSYSADKQYDTNDIGLHFPDIKIDEYYKLESNRNPVAIDSRIGEISYQMKVYMPEIPLLFAVYCVLHEYGHWLYFLDSKMSPKDYCEAERRIRQPYIKYSDEIYRMPDDNPLKILAAKQYDEKIYSQFPSEKSADQYSAEHISKSMTRIRNFLGYTEQDLLNQSLEGRSSMQQ